MSIIFNLITQLSQELAAKGIHLILINFPMSPKYKNTAYYSSDGPSWATATAVVVQFRALEASNSYFHFYDAYNNGVNDYSDADAFNCNHLCPNGAAKLTARLNTLYSHAYRAIDNQIETLHIEFPVNYFGNKLIY